MKISRNDPCPCGSGRKYKHCCLNKQTPAPSAAELTWRRIRRELEGLSERMLHFAVEAYGREMVDEAWWEFMLWDEDEPEFDAETPHLAMFLPWMLHHWSPAPDETDVADASLHGVTPAQAYLARKGRQLAPLIREYLQSCVDRPLSFYEAEQVVPGQGMTLRDLMTDERHEVHERGATQSLAVHEVVYAQLAAAGGLVLVEAICPVPLPPADKVPIIALRESLREEEHGQADPPSDIERQQMWDIELRELYLSLSDRFLYPTPPRLMTSDDEILEFHTLVYDIGSAQAAFDALRHLNPWAEGAPTQESGIRRHADGLIERAEIEWGRSDPDSDTGSGTVLGRIIIDGTRLTAEVQSRERADRLRDIIEDRLGAEATFRADEIRTPEQAMAESPASSPPPQPDFPETQAILAGFLRSHYERWPDMQLPALGNRTPRDVAQTPAGCEQVAALLFDAERHDQGLPATIHKSIFDAVRVELGLAVKR